MTDKQIKRKAFMHCLKIMWLSFTLFAVVDITAVIFRTLTAKTIGDFANNILTFNYNSIMESFWLLIILLLLSIFLEPALAILRTIVHFKQSLNHHSEVIKLFLGKDYLKAKKLGADLSFRWEEDLLYYRDIILKIYTSPLVILVTTIFTAIYLFEVPLYGFVCIGASLIPIITAFLTREKESVYTVQNSEYMAKRMAYEMDISSQYVYLKTNSIHKQFIDRVNDLFKSYFNQTGEKEIKLKAGIDFLNKTSIYLSQIIVVSAGVYLLSKGEIKAGQIASYLIYLVPVQDLIGQISILIKTRKNYTEYSKRIIPFYTDKENTDAKSLDEDIRNIEIKDLSFNYENDKKVIKNLSFSISRGEKIRISGKNGTGKSTLVKIISGLYSEYDGKLIINGKDYKDFNIDTIREKIAYIEQEPYFFAGSVEENIKIVNPETGMEKMDEILDKLNFKKNPEYKIENGGSNLSGGEKQKLAIARGLFRNSGIYIFDEPTNNLDRDSKKVLKEILESEENTVIYISHDSDLDTLADKTINL